MNDIRAQRMTEHILMEDPRFNAARATCQRTSYPLSVSPRPKGSAGLLKGICVGMVLTIGALALLAALIQNLGG